MQAATLPLVLRDGRDVVGAAETGSGKTLAFGIPILQGILQEREREHAESRSDLPDEIEPTTTTSSLPTSSSSRRRLRALVLCPTRELALQVCEHLVALGKHCDVRAVPLVGGIAPLKQQRYLAYRPEIVVATPGRLWDVMHKQVTSFF